METTETLTDSRKSVLKQNMDSMTTDADNFMEWCTQVEDPWDANLGLNGTCLKSNQKAEVPFQKKSRSNLKNTEGCETW